MSTASTTITFVSTTTSADASIQVKLDEEKNNGASSFKYGTKAYFQVYPYPVDMTLNYTVSDGTLLNEASGVGTIEETIIFADTNEGRTSLPIKNVLSTKWLGNNLGAVSATGGTSLSIPAKGVGVLLISYTADYFGKSISVPYKDMDEYPVVVFILGT